MSVFHLCLNLFAAVAGADLVTVAATYLLLSWIDALNKEIIKKDDELASRRKKAAPR